MACGEQITMLTSSYNSLVQAPRGIKSEFASHEIESFSFGLASEQKKTIKPCFYNLFYRYSAWTYQQTC